MRAGEAGLCAVQAEPRCEWECPVSVALRHMELFSQLKDIKFLLNMHEDVCAVQIPHAVLTACHVSGRCRSHPHAWEAPAPTLLCWCEVFQAILRFAWIELNDQLVVADVPWGMNIFCWPQPGSYAHRMSWCPGSRLGGPGQTGKEQNRAGCDSLGVWAMISTQTSLIFAKWSILVNIKIFAFLFHLLCMIHGKLLI